MPLLATKSGRGARFGAGGPQRGRQRPANPRILRRRPPGAGRAPVAPADCTGRTRAGLRGPHHTPRVLGGWADYLRFITEHPDLFPALRDILDPSVLAGSTLRAIVALQESWDHLDLLLSRDSEDTPGTQTRGSLELHQILGEQVSGMDSLHSARTKPQKALAQAQWRAAERWWMSRPACTLKDKRRLIACGGREAGWVAAMPSAREYQLTNSQWRDAISTRLNVPLSFLASGPARCDCHDAFDRRRNRILCHALQQLLQHGSGKAPVHL